MPLEQRGSSVRNRTLLIVGPGLLIGTVLCLIAAAAGRMHGGSGDSVMAKHELLGMASYPLSAAIGTAPYHAKERTQNRVVWGLVDYGPVVLNWAILSTVVVGSVVLVRNAGRRMRRSP